MQAALQSTELWHAELVGLAIKVQAAAKWAGLDVPQVGLDPRLLRMAVPERVCMALTLSLAAPAPPATGGAWQLVNERGRPRPAQPVVHGGV